MTLIYTCRLNKINPFEYLTELQRNSAALKANPADWMPWSYAVTLERQRAAAQEEGGAGPQLPIVG